MLLLTPQLAEQRPCSAQNHMATQELRVLYCARMQLATEGRDSSWGSAKEQRALGLLFPVPSLKVCVDVALWVVAREIRTTGSVEPDVISYKWR